MAQSKKVEEFTDAGSAASNDQLILNQSLANNQYQITNLTVSALFSNVPTGIVTSVDTLVIRQSSAPEVPISSNTAATPGTIWWDSDYVYIAVANNQVKRAALTTF